MPLRQISADEDIIVEVIDDGCGMDEKTMAYIFDKFCQGDTSHTAEGNGLGLALAQRIVRLLDGDITVQSEPGKGSVFTVRLRRMFTVTSDLSNF